MWLGLKIEIKSDEEIGKVAAAVPVLISRAIEMFMTRLLQDAEKQILQRNARTLTPQHIKQAINSHQVFIQLKACRSSENGYSSRKDLWFQGWFQFIDFSVYGIPSQFGC